MSIYRFTAIFLCVRDVTGHMIPYPVESDTCREIGNYWLVIQEGIKMDLSLRYDKTD